MPHQFVAHILAISIPDTIGFYVKRKSQKRGQNSIAFAYSQNRREGILQTEDSKNSFDYWIEYKQSCHLGRRKTEEEFLYMQCAYTNWEDSVLGEMRSQSGVIQIGQNWGGYTDPDEFINCFCDHLFENLG